MAWGEDSEGELGNAANETRQRTPATVAGLTGVKAIAAGMRDSAALLARAR
jgi:hypothetical protein